MVYYHLKEIADGHVVPPQGENLAPPLGNPPPLPQPLTSSRSRGPHMGGQVVQARCKEVIDWVPLGEGSIVLQGLTISNSGKNAVSSSYLKKIQNAQWVI